MIPFPGYDAIRANRLTACGDALNLLVTRHMPTSSIVAAPRFDARETVRLMFVRHRHRAGQIVGEDLALTEEEYDRVEAARDRRGAAVGEEEYRRCLSPTA